MKQTHSSRSPYASAETSGLLIEWYRANRILYPWRTTDDPYRVWLSEILLQQTRIPVVLKYYERILERFPTLHDLCVADESEFLALWSGVGYYSRAKNMLACARTIVENHNGTFPEDLNSLLQLPGIGRYTAGALRNICFEKLTPAIDGNIGRTLARLGAINLPIHSNEYNSKAAELYLRLAKGSKPSEFFQALMELGEQICLPQPRCETCPVQEHCVAHKRQKVDQLPLRRQKKKLENHHWYMLLLEQNEAFYYAQNARRGFLKDAWIFPDLFTPSKLSSEAMAAEFQRRWGIELQNAALVHSLNHSVTFRRINVQVYHAKQYKIHTEYGKWMTDLELAKHPTSSITAKILTATTLNRKSIDQIS